MILRYRLRMRFSKPQFCLSGQLSKALKRHTGLDVNPHLYRHIAAYFYLDAQPSDYERCTHRRVGSMA